MLTGKRIDVWLPRFGSDYRGIPEMQSEGVLPVNGLYPFLQQPNQPFRRDGGKPAFLQSPRLPLL